eukprot:m.56260 g.56260  ORF g.56260 m.56260 type:complete len:79 (+) comp34581_c0_seq1:671-907(+)
MRSLVLWNSDVLGLRAMQKELLVIALVESCLWEEFRSVAPVAWHFPWLLLFLSTSGFFAHGNEISPYKMSRTAISKLL